ncbi:RNA methyltransferase [Micrococcus luteus]|nr:RNA methyltransferase [Micrococcus luteus]MBN6766908.1 RNA methyltransferase [Micrococcus luteus]MBN6827954.1 RNA methyltransferase [Micrococcus luteus]MBN6844811.1 RNA methyltransferase [Micrococcus luteus]MBN6861360.1 RNA methyltransferase [Micrococcus luteus]MBN6863454.1 RNA methyltransferase [Micrococcus luteus]
MTDAALRRRVDAEHGVFLAESSQVVRRALDAGHTPRSFLLGDRYRGSFADVLAAHPEVPVFTGPDDVLEALTGFHLHRGALAAMDRPAPRPLADVLAGARRVLIAEDLVDHTNVCGPKPPHPERPPRRRIAVLEGLVSHENVGSAFRAAAALGVDAVLVTPSCADPLYRRAVRVSMGTVFQVPWTRLESWPGDAQLIKDAGYTLVGMTLGEGAITLDQLVAEDHDSLAFVFGTEGSGLSPATDALLDRRVTIPMMGGVDSLNVAAAAAVAFYATR